MGTAGEQEIAKAFRRPHSYHDEHGATREVIVIERDKGPTLVIDRLAGGHEDPMLVGEIGEAEDKENPSLLAGMWMQVPLADRRCGAYTAPIPAPPPNRRRAATAALAATTASPTAQTAAANPAAADAAGATQRATGRVPKTLKARSCTYKLEAVARANEDTSDLRWVAHQRGQEPAPVTLRAVVAAVEAYEPAITMCERAIANTPELWHGQLQRELDAMGHSRHVLNRGLREAVERAVASGTSLAEIAVRCGRIEITPSGAEKGLSSWVTRRTGMLDGPGTARRWIDIDLLAQIAAAIGLTPADVEL
jgi:hypothetical protein